jgi:hypothetical protein
MSSLAFVMASRKVQTPSLAIVSALPVTTRLSAGAALTSTSLKVEASISSDARASRIVNRWGRVV